jgi:lauroyl/myristoyl acyltransferase
MSVGPPVSPSAPLLTVNDVFLWLYLYPVRFLSLFLHRDLLYTIGRVGEIFAQPCSRRWKRIVVDRMLAADSGISRTDAPRLARQLVSNGIYHRLDDLVLSRSGAGHRLRCVGAAGLEHLEAAKAAGKGVIVLSGHFFASRLGNRYLATIGHPVLTVRHRSPSHVRAGRLGRRLLRPRIDELLHRVIQDEVSAHDRGCTLKILQRLRSGGLVDIHFDGRAGARPFQWPLMGIPRRFSSGIFDLVRLSECAVVPMLCVGRSTGFRIVFSPRLQLVMTATRDEFVAVNLATFVRVLEEQVQNNPEQWTLWDQP